MTAEPTPALDFDAIRERIETWDWEARNPATPANERIRALLPAARRTLERVRTCSGCNATGVVHMAAPASPGAPTRPAPCPYCAPDREELRAIVEGGS